jgi:hypothetical protein
MRPHNQEPNKKFIASDGVLISDSVLTGYVPERVLKDGSCRMSTDSRLYVTRASLQRALSEIDAKTLEGIRQGRGIAIKTWLRFAENF